jgi:ABC-type branched-subunit amino acid transport system substrate-binding protein
MTAAGALLLTGCAGLPGQAASGRQPITVMTWAPVDTNATNMPGMPAMAKAYARWVNASGGIDGHRLTVLTCNERNDPAGAAACAHKAVSEKVAAVVGSYSQYGQQFMAPLEAAGIPYLGGYGLSQTEFTSGLSYPVNGGQATLLAGNGEQVGKECSSVALVRPDTAAGDGLAVLLDAGLRGGTSGKAFDVRAPEDATDYTQKAQDAREDVGEDGCITAQLGDRTETFFDSYRRLPDDDRDIRVSSVLGSVTQSTIDASGGREGLFEGALVTGWYPEAGSAAWKPMKNVISKEAFNDPDVDAGDPGVQTTWIAYTALEQVVKAIGKDTVTAGDLVNALNNGVTVNTGGLTPPLRWRYQDMSGAPGYPRIVNGDVTFQVVRDGVLRAQRKGFVDVGRILDDAPVG